MANPQMARLQSLSTGSKVVAGALVVSFVTMFLPWAGVSSGPYSNSENGFHQFGLLFFLFWLIAAAFWIIRTFDTPVDIPTLPYADWMLYIIGGVVMLFAGLLFYVDTPHGSVSGFGSSVQWGVMFGWWIAVIAAAGLIAGGWLSRPGITGAPSIFESIGMPSKAPTSVVPPSAPPAPQPAPASDPTPPVAALETEPVEHADTTASEPVEDAGPTAESSGTNETASEEPDSN